MRLAFILLLFSFVSFSNENDLILKYNQCKKLSGKDLSLCSLEYGNLYTLNYTGKKYSNDDEVIKDIMKKEIGYYVFYCEKQSESLFKPLSV